jgi:hypothetical protein
VLDGFGGALSLRSFRALRAGGRLGAHEQLESSATKGKLVLVP